MRIFLDDEREPVETGWTIVRTVKEAQEACRRGLAEITEISLDHDLGESGTGMEFVNWLICADNSGEIGRLRDDVKFRLHTQNPVGRDNMAGTLSGYFLRLRGVRVALS